ncbi:MAG TPA: oxygenase MpaB family protein [Acidimicrobiales bacterium]|nr:oxygenase MpaB family protein [Acidimicrobiales bacterium]
MRKHPMRAPARAGLLSDWAREQVVGATQGLFSHGDYPLAGTLAYPGDPGLFGPGSATWTIVGDTSVFVGAIRALLLQAAHPEVAAGVFEHSRYREDPLGRLTRTESYVTATSYGAMPEVEAAVEKVRRRHGPIHGLSHRGLPYDASDPALDAWVHNALTDSFLTAYRVYGSGPCSEALADRYVAEQVRVGRLLDASPLPETAAALTTWITGHPSLGPSPGSVEAVRFLRRPPLPSGVRAGYGLLFRAAVATLPEKVRSVIGVPAHAGDLQVGRAAVRALRWALGASPDWDVALQRTGAPRPPGVHFRQPLRSPPALSEPKGARTGPQ